MNKIIALKLHIAMLKVKYDENIYFNKWYRILNDNEM